MAKGNMTNTTENDLLNTTWKTRDWVRRTLQKTLGELILSLKHKILTSKDYCKLHRKKHYWNFDDISAL